MFSRIGKTVKSDGNYSFNNVKGFALDAMNTDVFKRTESLVADDTSDFISDQVKYGTGIAEDKVKVYADVVLSFAKRNPLYIALGIVTLSLFSGAYLARKRG